MISLTIEDCQKKSKKLKLNDGGDTDLQKFTMLVKYFSRTEKHCHMCIMSASMHFSRTFTLVIPLHHFLCKKWRVVRFVVLWNNQKTTNNTSLSISLYRSMPQLHNSSHFIYSPHRTAKESHKNTENKLKKKTKTNLNSYKTGLLSILNFNWYCPTHTR